MTALFDATLALAGELGGLYDGQVGEGCTTALLVDGDLRAKASSLQYGALWFKTGNLAGVCLPVSLHSVGKLTFPQQGKAPTLGDLYSVLPPQFPLHLLRRSINQALQDIPKFTQSYHDASFVTVAEQQEYTLPTGISDLVMVEVATLTAAPWGWVESLHCRETARGKLSFIYGWQPMLSGYRIQLSYNIKHPWLPQQDIDTDKTLRAASEGDLNANEQDADWIDCAGADPCALTYVFIIPKAEGTTPTLDVKVQLSSDGVNSEDEYVLTQITQAGMYEMSFKTSYQYRRYYATVGGADPDFGKVIIAPRIPDLILPGINLERLKWEAAVHAYRFYLQAVKSTGADDPTTDFMAEARGNARAVAPHDVKRISKAPILAGY